jgi:phosphinothricin acetyltransferase
MCKSHLQKEPAGLFFEAIQQEHLTACLDIYKYYVENSTATFHTHVPSMEEFKGIVYFGGTKNKGFAILQDGCICGYIVLGRYSIREAYDDTGSIAIYLSCDCCNKGIGNAALVFLEQYAREQGFHSLVATICGENGQSIRLFERNGYIKCAHFKELGKKFGRLLDIVAYQKVFE